MKATKHFKKDEDEKIIKRCFGTAEFSSRSNICKDCKIYDECKKTENRKRKPKPEGYITYS